MALKKGLGKGLDAFFNTEPDDANSQGEAGQHTAAEAATGDVIQVDINKIEPNREQPRKTFEEQPLIELADSITQFGVLQPLIVKKEDGYYSIIAGERRWRAARMAKLAKLPVIIRDYTKIETLEVALIENIQRADLNPIEEALSYKRLIEEYHLKQEEIAKKVGKNRSTITNALRLLNLDPRVQNFIVEMKLSMGHARALLAIAQGEAQFELAEKVIEEGLSVREVEGLVRDLLNPTNTEAAKKEAADVQKKAYPHSTYVTIEKDLKSIFGTNVNIREGKNKGKIEIEYYNPQELDRLLILMRRMSDRYI